MSVNHAPFVESFNKYIKFHLNTYMIANDTNKWIHQLDNVVNKYNNKVHSSTGIAPNSINKSNEGNAWVAMMEKAKFKHYEEVKPGDHVRVPIINNGYGHKGYQAQWSSEIKTVLKNNGDSTYQLEGESSVRPRKDLQKINATNLKTVETIKPKKKKLTALKQAIIDAEVSSKKLSSKDYDLVKNETKSQALKRVKEALESDTVKTRSQTKRNTRASNKK